MKKIYLTIISVTAVIASVFAQTVPTCSLNTTFIASNKVGVWPDSATNFISGTVGIPYEQNLTVKVPKDTSAAGFTFCFNKFVLYTPVGVTNYNLPPGLNIGSSTTAVANGTVNGSLSLKFPGNANNCASIYGTPTVAGSYTLQLEIQPYTNGPVVPIISPCSNNPASGSTVTAGPQVLNYYVINISAPTGLQDLGNDKMSLSQNVPNPFSSTTDIKFYVEGEDNATVTVYNTLGAIVSQQSVYTSVGENKVTIKGSNLSNGTYMYSLKYKGAIATKRMMIINN
jgi:hypothetical protein